MSDTRTVALRTEKKFPVLWDKEGKLTKKFRIRSWPTGMLVGPDRKVIWVGSPTQWFKDLEGRIRDELRKLPKWAATQAAAQSKIREPLWLTEKEATGLARDDGKWIFLFKYCVAAPGCKKFYKATLADQSVIRHLTANFHCIISDDPAASTRKREQGIWRRSNLWDRTKLVWLIHPKLGKRAAIDYLVKGKAIGPAELIRRLKEATQAE